MATLPRNLIHKNSTYILDSLANQIGTEPAFIFGKIAFWTCQKNCKVVDGRSWYRKSLRKAHQEDFRSMSFSTFRRHLITLRNLGLVATRTDIGEDRSDQVLHYTITEKGETLIQVGTKGAKE